VGESILGYEPVSGFCERRNKTSRFIKEENFLVRLESFNFFRRILLNGINETT
jgi:hypothetical protein